MGYIQSDREDLAPLVHKFSSWKDIPGYTATHLLRLALKLLLCVQTDKFGDVLSRLINKHFAVFLSIGGRWNGSRSPQTAA